MNIRQGIVTIALCSLSALAVTTPAYGKPVNVLVIAISGHEAAIRQWSPTIDYLQQQIPQAEFNLIPVLPGETQRLHSLLAAREID